MSRAPLDVAHRRPLAASLAAMLAAWGVAAAFFINLCDLVYDCGCRSWWNGLAEQCNIHDPSSRHCPWCASGILGLVLPLGLILLTQAAVVWWPGRTALPRRLLFALLAFPLVGTVVAVAWGVAVGYWA